MKPRRHSAGYILAYQPDHSRAQNDGYVFEHIIIAEAVLGKPLPPGAEIHHVNGNKGDNSSGNLVICQDRAYHMLLHKRERALRACGNPNYRPCAYCKEYDDTIHMSLIKSRDRYFHRKCLRDHGQAKRDKNRKSTVWVLKRIGINKGAKNGNWKGY